jgi:hypothetical protein
MVGTCHHTDPVAISWLLLASWASRDNSWLLLLCSIKLWPIIQATGLKSIFLFSLRWPLCWVNSINRSCHVPCLSIEASLNSSLIKFLAFVTNISDQLFLTIIAPKVERPVIGDQSLWIWIHIRHCKLRSGILIILRILSAMLIKLFLRCSFLLAGAIYEVFIFFLLHGVVD